MRLLFALAVPVITSGSGIRALGGKKSAGRDAIKAEVEVEYSLYDGIYYGNAVTMKCYKGDKVYKSALLLPEIIDLAGRSGVAKTADSTLQRIWQPICLKNKGELKPEYQVYWSGFNRDKKFVRCEWRKHLGAGLYKHKRSFVHLSDPEVLTDVPLSRKFRFNVDKAQRNCEYIIGMGKVGRFGRKHFGINALSRENILDSNDVDLDFLDVENPLHHVPEVVDESSGTPVDYYEDPEVVPEAKIEPLDTISARVFVTYWTKPLHVDQQAFVVVRCHRSGDSEERDIEIHVTYPEAKEKFLVESKEARYPVAETSDEGKKRIMTHLCTKTKPTDEGHKWRLMSVSSIPGKLECIWNKFDREGLYVFGSERAEEIELDEGSLDVPDLFKPRFDSNKVMAGCEKKIDEIQMGFSAIESAERFRPDFSYFN